MHASISIRKSMALTTDWLVSSGKKKEFCADEIMSRFFCCCCVFFSSNSSPLCTDLVKMQDICFNF